MPFRQCADGLPEQNYRQVTEKEFIDSYLPLSNSLYRVAIYILESSQDAEDVLQDLYIKLWQSRGNLDIVRNPKAYCTRLLKNMCIDRIRRTVPNDRLLESASVTEDADAQSSLESREQLGAALDAMDTLSESMRRVLRMRVFEDLSYEDMAKRTGMNNLTLRVLLSQARRKIRRAYEKDRRH